MNGSRLPRFISLRHRDADFVNTLARATVSSDGYRVELGWIVIAKSHQGGGLSSRIIGELIALVQNENVFATTRVDERAMRFASDYGFELNGKPYPSGRRYDRLLYLRNAAQHERSPSSNRVS